jgi:superfamily II DNA or RNA helicase
MFNKAGIYFWRNPYHISKGETTRKIGYSKDIYERFSHVRTYFRPEEEPVYYINLILYSKNNLNSGLSILETITHHYYIHNREYKTREIFSWDNEKEFNDTIENLKDHFLCKGIFDIEIFKNLSDIPEYIREVDIEKKHFDLLEMEKDKIYKPNDKQLKILNKVVEYYKNKKIGKLVLPPGLGKTYISGFFLRETPEIKNIIIFTPQIMICEEWTKMFSRLAFQEKDIFVCNSENYDILKISNKLEMLDRKIVITTYQTYMKNPKSFQKGYDIVIYDEAHHLATGEEYRKCLEITGKKLFLTATPKIVHRDRDDEVVRYSLDNEDVYGEEIYKSNIEECIEEGYLTDYRIVYFREKNYKEPEIDTEENSEIDTEDNSESDTEENSEIDREKEIQYLDPTEHIESLISTYGRKKISVFYNTRENAKKGMKALNYPCEKYYIDGETKKDKRKEIIDSFTKNSDNPQVLFNIDVLREGVSIDCIDTVILMEDRKSTIVLTQIFGRMLRLYPGKLNSIICIPERCVDTFSCLLESVYHDCPERGKKIKTKVFFEGVKDKQSCEKVFKDKVETEIELIEIDKDVWSFKLGLCTEWEGERENKGKDIVKRLEYKKFNIGRWLDHQKTAFNRGKLTRERLKKLEQLKTWKNWLAKNQN